MVTQRTARRGPANGEANKLLPQDRAVHDWYRFVLSFPPHLVREYLQRFGVDAGQTVLDPFCGTGTTLVECKKLGILICRPIGAQFMADDLIALFSFEEGSSGIAIAAERHYRLVLPEQVTEADLAIYRARSE